MKVVILQSNYMPWRGYFDLIKDSDIFCFYDEVKYTKTGCNGLPFRLIKKQ